MFHKILKKFSEAPNCCVVRCQVISDIKKSKTAVCCSIGWLVSHTSKTNVVMADFIFEDNGKIKQGGGYTTIPTKNVLSIKKIKL